MAVKQAFTYSSGPIDGVTGAPNEGNCTQCHSGTVNSGTATLAIEVVGSPGTTTFNPGQTYDMQVSFGNDTRTTHGFELTAVGQNGENGTIIVSDQVNTQLSNSGGQQYIKHTTAGHLNRSSWTFKWQAPAAGASGVVRFYAAGNSANGNGDNTGDNIYTTSLMLEEVLVANKPVALEANTLNVWPNPATTMTTVSFGLQRPAQTTIALYDLQGKQVASQELGQLDAGKHNQRFTIPSDVPSGTYILRVEADGKASAVRMNILKV